jgi:hypothetical protein
VSDLADVLAGFATTVKNNIGSDPLSGRTFAYAPDSMVTPWAVALPGPGDFLQYDVTFDGADEFALLLKVIIGTEITRTGQTQLLSYMDRTGSTSLRAAVYADKTLAGTVSDLKVVGWQNYNDVEWAGVQYLGAELVVVAYT